VVDNVAWIGAITLGLAAGGFVFHFPGSYGEPAWSAVAGLFGLLIGAINGVAVGALGWVALRLPRRTGGSLLVAMTLIVGSTHALNDGASRQVSFAVIQALAALLTAGVWAVVMGERRPATLAVVGGAWWLGLLLADRSGDLLGLPWTETPVGWSMDHAWDGVVTGVVWGTATAAIGVPATLRARRAVAEPSVTLPSA
jgi:hypothetical protein